MSERRPIVWFDSDCILCNRTVQFVIVREYGERLTFGSLRSDQGQERVEKHFGEKPLDSILYETESGKCHHYSDAALLLCSHLRAPWKWLIALRAVPRPIRDFLYRFIARNRHNWLKSDTTCVLSDPSYASRIVSPTPKNN